MNSSHVCVCVCTNTYTHICLGIETAIQKYIPVEWNLEKNVWTVCIELFKKYLLLLEILTYETNEFCI